MKLERGKKSAALLENLFKIKQTGKIQRQSEISFGKLLRKPAYLRRSLDLDLLRFLLYLSLLRLRLREGERERPILLIKNQSPDLNK
jgi:hypothetical protein